MNNNMVCSDQKYTLWKDWRNCCFITASVQSNKASGGRSPCCTSMATAGPGRFLSKKPQVTEAWPWCTVLNLDCVLIQDLISRLTT